MKAYLKMGIFTGFIEIKEVREEIYVPLKLKIDFPLWEERDEDFFKVNKSFKKLVFRRKTSLYEDLMLYEFERIED